MSVLMSEEGVSMKEKKQYNSFLGCPRFWPPAPPQGPEFMECKQTLQGTHDTNMNAF